MLKLLRRLYSRFHANRGIAAYWKRRDIGDPVDNSALHQLLNQAIHNTVNDKPNWRRLANGCYLVRTQAGFKQACKDAAGYSEDNKVPRKYLRNVSTWPKAYPSVCRLNFAGGCYMNVTVSTLDDYRKKTQALLDDLKGE